MKKIIVLIAFLILIFNLMGQTDSTPKKSPMHGLRTVVYKVPDLNEAIAWYSKAFGTEPYFNQPYYAGFNIGGYELGLLPLEKPVTDTSDNVIAYWGVQDIQKEFQHLINIGATSHEEPTNVGGELMVASVYDPWGNVIGIIYNPHFELDTK